MAPRQCLRAEKVLYCAAALAVSYPDEGPRPESHQYQADSVRISPADPANNPRAAAPAAAAELLVGVHRAFGSTST